MADVAASQQPEKKRGGPGRPFPKGQSGNPDGPKKGRRHPAFAALDQIGQENAERIVQAVTASALRGDMRAAEIMLRRVWPERKGRPLSLSLPPLTDAADLSAAMATIIQAVTAGEITPDEGQALSALIEAQRKTIETHDLAARMDAIEQLLPKGKP
ncbi:hypothetical protein GLI01_23550 [Gluconacetobacter liquefaciens]|uniref:DUF5681 domain-containing protein n=2 Tax=Gluconacetobacter liquefaciens TaxID=89584 RepID=A0A7W4PD65_GLULI|nr:DUF5681 domain-containing protein [Gluconacetobacter liquefaciens]MBB2186481.1 hypothetical protein [Gluconacetobacter liquefaciens]GBR09447.1 hypothetical protein AA0522_2330 [Gluconacetobacter liquefaciens NRIC 0522]GEB38320.1 hypothetical protein GLI01_23550 [Gluconacetobacter liquefaciens]